MCGKGFVVRRQAWPIRAVGGVLLLLMLAVGAWFTASAPPRGGAGPDPDAAARRTPDGSAAPGPQSAAAVEERPEVGYLAPDFALPDLAGRTVRLSDFRGRKAVFLNFWATWCPPCRAEMPTMEQAYQAYRGQGLEILAVSVDTAPKETVQAFMAELTLSFPALLDPDMAVLYAYRVLGLPASVLIDRQGVIRAVEIGYRDWYSAESRKRLESLLGDRASEPRPGGGGDT